MRFPALAALLVFFAAWPAASATAADVGYSIVLGGKLASPPIPDTPWEPDDLNGVVAVDFDKDGDADLVALTAERLAVYLSNGTGTFAAPAIYWLPEVDQPGRLGGFIAGADFNKDGFGDVLVARGGTDSMLMGGPGGIGRWIARSGPDGYFPSRAGVLVRDVNRDGKLDWIIQESDLVGGDNSIPHSEIAIYLGDGTGMARERIGRPLDLGQIEYWDVGDLNGDGAIDLVLAAMDNLPIGVYVMHGDGGTGFHEPELIHQRWVDALSVGDLNGDDRDDLAVSMVDAPFHGIGVWFQDPSGELPAQPAVRALPVLNDTPYALFAADVDGDGVEDLVALDQNQQHGHVLRTIGGELTGDTFVTLPTHDSQSLMYDGDNLALADLNGDGTKDWAVASRGYGLAIVDAYVARYTGGGNMPGAPAITSITDNGAGSAKVFVTPPADDGNEPIIGYRVAARRTGSGDDFEPYGGVGPAPVNFYAYGETGQFDVLVRAVNAVGVGPASPSVSVALTNSADAGVSLSLKAMTTEAEQASAGFVWVHASLSWTIGSTVTFDVRTRDGTAVAGQDFAAVSIEGATILPGERTFWFKVPLIDDGEVEGDEMFMVEIANIRGIDHHTGTVELGIGIRDDDATMPNVTLAADTMVEGTVTGGIVRAVATLSKYASDDVVVELKTIAGSATSGQDYRARQASLVIPRGELTAVFEVQIIPDADEEAEETFVVRAVSISGPVAATAPINATARILNDDFAGAQPVLARPDRFEVQQNSVPVTIYPFANDVFVDSEANSSTFAVRSPHGTFSHTRGDGARLGDDKIWYKPDSDYTGSDSLTYMLCEVDRCAIGKIEILVRPIAADGLNVEAVAASGFADFTLTRLQALADARFRVTPMVDPFEIDIELPIDPTPLSPWDGGNGTSTFMGEAPDGDVRVLAEAIADGEVDLYAGIDADGDGRADPDEVRCSSAATSPRASCEIALGPSENRRYWVHAHNRGTTEVATALYHAAVELVDGDARALATGPGHLLRGDAGRLRLSWNDPDFLPGDLRVAYVGVVADATADTIWTPARIGRTGTRPSPAVLSQGVDTIRVLQPNQLDRHTFVDVPAGASELVVESASDVNVDLYLVHVPDPSSPEIVAAPAVPPGAPTSTQAHGNERIVVSGEALLPGRWYAITRNRSDAIASVTLRVGITAVAPIVRPGSYFDSARSGHGVVFYPAGDEWAGLWYTYFQDGTPTWLYLQAPAPGPDGIWHSGLYRAAWNGTANRLTRVGDATVTATGPDAFRFTWTLDGETGSEPMQSLGRGCPALAGVPLDASSHWFDPRRAGTGYSVQLWPEYEMYLAFVYDAQGVPRFLTAENPRFGGEDEILALEQLQGFCPLCTRRGAPARRDIGTFSRAFTGGRLRFGIDGIYEATVPGWWTTDDVAQLLGGTGTSQGCGP